MRAKVPQNRMVHRHAYECMHVLAVDVGSELALYSFAFFKYFHLRSVFSGLRAAFERHCTTRSASFSASNAFGISVSMPPAARISTPASK